jgi:hypothetical protein
VRFCCVLPRFVAFSRDLLRFCYILPRFCRVFAAILATILQVSMSLYLMMEVPSFGGMGDVTRMKDEAQNFRLVEAEIRWVVFSENSRDKRSSLFCQRPLVTEKKLLI